MVGKLQNYFSYNLHLPRHCSHLPSLATLVLWGIGSSVLRSGLVLGLRFICCGMLMWCGSGDQMNKSASTILPHRRRPSRRSLKVDGIVCLSAWSYYHSSDLGWTNSLCVTHVRRYPRRCRGPSEMDSLERQCWYEGGWFDIIPCRKIYE
jgi:hypothetical protein